MHQSRLNRPAGNKVDDLRGYAEEELVAELGATFLAIQRGVESTPRQDHISYIQSWLTALDNDPKFIQKASTKAWKASQWIMENAKEEVSNAQLVA